MKLLANHLRKAFEANSTGAAVPSLTPAATKPSGTGIFDLFDADLGLATEPYAPEWLQVIPFGTDGNNETFDLYVSGWSRSTGGLWVPQLLANLAVTLGNISASAVGTNHFLADTIAVTDGGAATNDFGVMVVSPENDTPGHALIPLRGCELIRYDVNIGVSAAAANAFWRTMNRCG